MRDARRVESALRLVAAPRRLAVPAWAATVVVVWLALLGVYETIKPAGAPGLCLWREITGVPCPTCGSTRAFFAASHGHFGEALRLNPLLGAAAVGSAAWLVLRVGFGRTLKLELSTRARRAVWCGVTVLLALNWAYVIAYQAITEPSIEPGRSVTGSASFVASPPP